MLAVVGSMPRFDSCHLSDQLMVHVCLLFTSFMQRRLSVYFLSLLWNFRNNYITTKLLIVGSNKFGLIETRSSQTCSSRPKTAETMEHSFRFSQNSWLLELLHFFFNTIRS